MFIPLKVAKVVERMVNEQDITPKEALIAFYNFKVYAILEREETKLWYEGPNYLYQAIQMEQRGEHLDI